MGVGVSDWKLARTVSMLGQLGVVSGTALDILLSRRLQLGDPGGHMRRAMAHFPIRDIADRVLEKYFVEGGKNPDKPFKSKPMPVAEPSEALNDLIVVANFVEVFLAKEGHSGKVGVNLLQKIQVPTVPSLYGAMLAGVDFVLMGAGIPRAIPGVLDKLARLEPTDLPIDVSGARAEDHFVAHFDPSRYIPKGVTALVRPFFLAIVSSASLALMLARKATGKVDGFVIEGATAGGHNAPPRGAMTLSETGEPVYGPRDLPDLQQFRDLGVPFWLAGSYGNKNGLQMALKEGAAGIQVGTAFAFCEDSGIDPALKAQVIDKVLRGEASVFTDPLASPTGFPFKVVELEGTVSEAEVFEHRTRICDLGYLREPYRLENGKLGYRCASEPVEDFVKKGGDIAETVGRKCICNGLAATIGIAQVRKDGYVELPIMTGGDQVVGIAEFLEPGKKSYSAEHVVKYLLGA